MSTDNQTFVEFTADVGSWKAGSIEALKAPVARGLIEAGQAKESDSLAYMRASLDAANEKRFASLKNEIVAALKPEAPKGPPNGGGGVDFTKISAGTPAEEQDKNRCFTDALRCVFLIEAQGTDPKLREYAVKRMRGYASEYTEYKMNESTGQLDSTVTRNLADGGVETIVRTGSDSVSGGPTYGFTVKPTFLSPLFRISREAEVFASGCRQIPVSSGNEAIWPALDQFNAPVLLNGIMQSAVFAGVTMSYLGETTARISSDAKVRENRYKVMDLTGMTDFSRDYIVDNYIAMDTEVTRIFGEAVGWLKDWTYINGDGIGCPQGFLNANATLTTGPNAGARYTTNTIYSDDLVYMMSRMHTGSIMRARWLANITTFTQIWALLNKSNTPIFQPNALIDQSMMLKLIQGTSVDEASLVARPMGLLLGLPIYFSEKMPTLGTSGDICLVDPFQYGDAVRSGLEVGVSEHFYFSTDRIAYRFKYRHFGKSLWPSAYTQADDTASASGGTQVSPFVALHS